VVPGLSVERVVQENGELRSPTGATVFALLDDVREDLRATGYIADWMATTTVCLPAKLHKPVLLEGARRNLHMRLPGLPRQVSSACGVTKASMTRKPA
jgi:hypothetical protein